MKRPGRRDGHGGPKSGDEPEDEERARAERARRERIRAQKRLAAKAGGESGGERAPKSKEKAKPTGEKPKGEKSKPTGERPKGEKPKAGRPKARAAKAESPKPGRNKAGASKAGAPRPGGARAAKPRTRGKREKRGAGVGSALKQGVSATRSRTKGVPSRVGAVVLKALGAVFAIFFGVIGFVLGLILFVLAFLRGPVRAGLAALGRMLRLASRVVTPARVLTVVVAGAAVLLALSQFADYRSISVGTDAYAEVQTVAPAPEQGRDETGSAHSYLMVPLAVVALGLLAAAVIGRRPRLCRGVAAIGAVAVLVSLLVDRPAGLDLGDLELQYDGVQATLLGGFYAQLFAGALLIAAALLLGRELRPAAAADEVRGSRREPRRLTRRPPPEGARA